MDKKGYENKVRYEQYNQAPSSLASIPLNAIVTGASSSTAIPDTLCLRDSSGSAAFTQLVASTFTGSFLGNATTATSAATVTTAAQPSITSVGTLTGLTVTNTIVGSINGNAATATSATSATTAGTVTTAAQPAITSVGTLTGLTVSSTITGSINGNAATVTNGLYTTGVGTIINSNLLNSSVTINGSPVSLGGSITVSATATEALTIGTGLSGSSYNGSTAVTIANTGITSLNSLTGDRVLVAGKGIALTDVSTINLSLNYLNGGASIDEIKIIEKNDWIVLQKPNSISPYWDPYEMYRANVKNLSFTLSGTSTSNSSGYSFRMVNNFDAVNSAVDDFYISDTDLTNNIATDITGMALNFTGAVSFDDTILVAGALPFGSGATGDNSNVAIGISCLESNVSGTNNLAIGSYALTGNTDGVDNVAIGFSTLLGNLTGNQNTALGSSSLLNNTTGSDNIAIGFNALYSDTAPNKDIALGSNSLYNKTSGHHNTALGHNSGRWIGTGTTAMTSATSGLYLGYQARGSANGLTNEIVIGTNAVGLGSNTTVIGHSTNTLSATVHGVVNTPDGILTSNINNSASSVIYIGDQAGAGNTTYIKIDDSAPVIHLQSLIGGVTLAGFVNLNNSQSILTTDATNLYAQQASGKGVVPATMMIMPSADYTLTNGTSVQDVFSDPIDTITLAASTTYIFKGSYIINSGGTTHITSMSFAGTATMTSINFNTLSWGQAAPPVTPIRAQDTNSFSTVAGGNINTTNTSVFTIVNFQGVLRVDNGGTFIPQLTFSSAPGGTNLTKVGSYLTLYAVGTNTVTSVGAIS